MTAEIRNFLARNLKTEIFDIAPIKKGGSDRNFYRVRRPDQSTLILMHYGSDVAENDYWADIARFLAAIKICVPQIIAQDANRHFILLTDAGETDLWSQRTVPWRQRRDYYYAVLRQIRTLHTFNTAMIPAGLRLTEGYSEKLYRWEQQYFQNNFVQAVCHLQLDPARQKELTAELDGLIARLQKLGQCLIHRDLQSQNIMLQDGIPMLIDFQGMRKGCLFYDLGSLICDPYVSLTASERNELLLFYYNLLKPSYGFQEFTGNFWQASAQRLMQALGAYGFLGLKKKKPDFLKHIDNGINNLLTAAQSARLPALHKLARQCTPKLIKNEI
ncbi:MAG TPA: phosphotransferase [Smithellaceae bacterium]|nr:phosphotransferase [Smithellaceae bacterium]